jgi:hypothetical protein
MSHIVHDPRLVAVPQSHRDFLRDTVSRLGPRAAAKYLGIGRTAIIGTIALGECMPGTAALVREAVARDFPDGID